MRFTNVLDTDKELINGKVRRPKFLLARVFRRLERYFITDTMGGWRRTGFHPVWTHGTRPRPEDKELIRMRLGQNPSKDKLPAYQPARLGDCSPILYSIHGWIF